MDAVTQPDHAQSEGLRALARAHMSPVLGRYFERTWSHGEGHRLFDDTGRSYLDFANGIAVTSLGHRHPRVNAAIHAQIDRLIGPTNAIGYSEPVVRFVGMLADALPDPIDTVFLGNSGTEAVEGALKLARRVTGRPGIIAFSGGFHGRTFGSLSVTTSNINYRTGYEPLLSGVHIAPFPHAYQDHGGDVALATEDSLRQLRRILAEVIPPSAVAAFLIEPVQGEGGYTPAPVAFLQGLRELADAHGILLIADEVQSGYGRTGRMWGFEHSAIVPDVVCIAKSIANGLPLAAIATRRELQERWGRGAHGSTYGGNPVACAAAIAVLETILDEGIVENAAVRGEELRGGLDGVAAEEPRIGDVRGLGLMVGVEFVTDRETREPDAVTAESVRLACADAGLLLLSCGVAHNVIRWIPPLNVSASEIAEGIDIFSRVVQDVPATPPD